MDGHLDALFRASALENKIEPVLFTKRRQCRLNVFFCSSELFVSGFCFVDRREAEYL